MRILLLEKPTISSILLGTVLDTGMVVLMKSHNCNSATTVLLSDTTTLVSWTEWQKVLNQKLKK